VNPDGDILWSLDQVSWYATAQMVAGEPGYFYLTFPFGQELVNLVAQRMDIDGNTFWPSFGSLEGIPLISTAHEVSFAWESYVFQSPYLYCTTTIVDQPTPNHLFEIHAQAIDTMGNRVFPEEGAILSRFTGHYPMHNTAIIDEADGIVNAFGTVYSDNIYAKRINLDGTLGGPLAVKVPVEQKQVGPLLYSAGQSIHYAVDTPGEIMLELYDILGRRMAVLAEGFRNPGSYTSHFKCNNLPTGMYFIRLSTPQSSQVAKMVVVR
jgi:hypothetical protein